MIGGRNFLDEPIKNNIKTYENVKISTSHWDDYITGCLFRFLYFKAIKINFIKIFELIQQFNLMFR